MRIASRPRSRLTENVELSDVHDIPEFVKFHVDWSGISRPPLLNLTTRNIGKIVHRIYLGLSYIGGKLSCTSVAYG